MAQCLGTTDRGKRCKLNAKAGKEYCTLHQFSTIIVSVQCAAVGRNGSRCKHRTTRSTLCWQHLKKEKNLRIKKSLIPKAGMGLFATAEFSAGTKIAPYSGDIVVTNDRNYGDNYALQIKKRPPTYISARRSNTGEGRYANDKRGGIRNNNSALLYDSRMREAYLRATKLIPAGSEITTPYGAAYWSR